MMLFCNYWQRAAQSAVLGLACFVIACSDQSGSSSDPISGASSSATEQAPEVVYQSLGEELDSFFARNITPNRPGLALLVMQQGEVVFHRAEGAANRAADIPITQSTGFRVASISKSFTALAIMQLVEQGQLKVSDSVRLYIPELAASWQKIRIEHLLSHRSGVPDVLTPFSAMDKLSNRQAIARYAANPSLNFEPGSGIAYSNTNYVLLAEVVERASGYSFADYLRLNIFAAANMADSYLADESTPLRSQDALNYAERTSFFNGITAYLTGNMGQVSSTRDFIGFFKAMRNNQIVSEQTLAVMVEPKGSLFGGQYGFGFMLYPGSLGHGGLFDGFRTEMTINSNLDLQFVMLSNGGGRTQNYINEIRSIIYSWY